MRKMANALEKGKWYADNKQAWNFLRFSHEKDGIDYFDMIKNVRNKMYIFNIYGFIKFRSSQYDYFIPTKEDKETYNLK